jgi:hypothetical protein
MTARRSPLTVTLPSGTVAVARGLMHGLPLFGWRQAPTELLTFRQLASVRLRPITDPVALLGWGRVDRDGHPRRTASLYPIDQVREVLPMTPGRRRSIAAALAGRQVCEICGPVDHYVRSGLCAACFTVAGPTRPISLIRSTDIHSTDVALAA